MSPSRLQRRTVHYSGHVQGVGFRFTTRGIAAGFDVQGFVKNLSDGRVQLVAEGSRGELDRFLAEVDRELGGYIQSRQADETDATGEFTGFEVRY